MDYSERIGTEAFREKWKVEREAEVADFGSSIWQSGFG